MEPAKKSKVKIACGAFDDYKGIIDPKLDVVFLQTDAEKQKYQPAMDYLVENGLETEGSTISGI